MLMFCPDAILARCAPCDPDACADASIDYIVVARLDSPSRAILDLTGKWTFDYARRAKWSCSKYARNEDFVLARTLIVSNLAYVAPEQAASTSAFDAVHRSTLATKASPGDKARGLVARLIERTRAQKASAAGTSSSDGKATGRAFAALVSKEHYIVRTLMPGRMSMIALTPVERLSEIAPTLGTTSVAASATGRDALTDEVAHDIETMFATIRANEPEFASARAIFDPTCSVTDGTSRNFNYWRGWHIRSDVDTTSRRTHQGWDMSIVQPIIDYINTVICADPYEHDIAPYALCENASRIISWFAHIVQSPGSAPERQLVLRGFARESIAPLIEFIGRTIIGQYYDGHDGVREYYAHERNDRLLAFIDNVAPDEVESLMRKKRGLWKVARPSAPDVARMRRPGLPLTQEREVDECDQSFVHHDLERVVLRVACARQLPIESARRRFGIIDTATAPASSGRVSGQSSTGDARHTRLCANLHHAMARDDAPVSLFRFLANYGPLTLFWE
jgi:hypothetical protein